MARITPPEARFGWAGPEAAKRANDLMGHLFPRFFIQKQTVAAAGQRVVLWDASKKATGAHLPTLNQQIGDCVSMGATNATDYLSCADIVIRNQSEKFRHAFMPYVYGTSRVLVGGQRNYSDGSVGVWAADAVRKYGVLWADYTGVPAYSKDVAKEWGAKGPPKDLVTYATAFPIKTTAKVSSYTEARDALSNYYPIAVCSNRGFKMNGTAVKVGDRQMLFGSPSGTWNHCMCFCGVDDNPTRPALYCLNSWGPDAHGAPLDGAPPGGFWVDAEVADKMLKQDDSFAYSDLVGFPERSLDYMLI